MPHENELNAEENASDSQYGTYDTNNSLQTESPVVNENYQPNVDAARNFMSTDLNSHVGTRPTAESTRRIREIQNQHYDPNPGVSRISLSPHIYSHIGTGSTNESPQRNHEIPNPNINSNPVGPGPGNHQQESKSFCTFCHVHFRAIVIVLLIGLILGIDFTNLKMFYRFSLYDAS